MYRERHFGALFFSTRGISMLPLALIVFAVLLTVVGTLYAGWGFAIGVAIAAPICFGMGMLSSYLQERSR